MNSSSSRSGLTHSVLFLAALVFLYGGIFYGTNFLSFPPEKDELHFWPTSLSFSQTFLPTIEQLRSYNELNTPLPFVVFGWVEHIFHAGIAGGRFFNLVVSFAIVCIIGFCKGKPTLSTVLPVVGLLSFPYFLGVSTHLYTDVIAAFFAVLGVAAHQRRAYYFSVAFFILAIACRQYMLAFPVAVFASEAIRPRRDSGRCFAALASPCIAAFSILGWYIFFGGLAPEVAVREQAIATADTLRFFPNHALYFLATVGVYFVIPEAVLFRRLPSLPSLKQSLLIVTLMAALFLLFPPLNNSNYPIPTMGFMDKAARLLLPDVLRLILFYLCALLACFRFCSATPLAFLVYANAGVMMKAHIAWDKYTLPLLVVLWFLIALDARQAVKPQI